MLMFAADKKTDTLPNTEADLEILIAEAEELFERYEDGLPIRVSFVSAWLAGELSAWWGGLQREWYPTHGIMVQRSYHSMSKTPLPDSESFSLEAIVGAQKPDVDYVWFIDLVRKPIMFWNKWLGWLVKWPVPDHWGKALVRTKEGRETILLEHMVSPLSGFDYIRECSETMLKAFRAIEKLKKMRAEQRAQPSFEKKVDLEAKFQLAVAKRMAELRQSP